MGQIMSTKLRGNLMLFLTALIWGVSFVAQKAGMEYIGPFTFNGIRFLVGSIVLIPLILIMGRIQTKKDSGEPAYGSAQSKIVNTNERKTLLLGGLSCGVVLFVSSSLQQIGILYTTAGKAGFITALYIVLVPLLGLFIGRRVRPILWVCVALAAAGLYLLCVKEGFSIGRGDLLVILCAFGYAIHILVIDYFSPKADGVKLSCLQFFVAGVISIPFMAIFESINWTNVFACWLPILYSGVMSCGIAYTLQIIAQKYTEPTVASLILSLESVFAVIAGIILLSEQVSPRELLGCAIMFAAILLAQLPSKEERISII
jgi:drug/metabolite transporter (DMT)-like permease